ncbi:hypothetical protein LEMLEM_LOCUS27820, partial [Lemmus lemmus]
KKAKPRVWQCGSGGSACLACRKHCLGSPALPKLGSVVQACKLSTSREGQEFRIILPTSKTVELRPLRHRTAYRQVGYFLQRRPSQDAAQTPSLQGRTCAQLIRKET